MENRTSTNLQSVLALADSTQSKPAWSEVREALDADDVERLSKLRQQYIAECERNARKHYLKGLAIQSVVAASYGDIVMALKADENDALAHFKHQILMNFAVKHGLTVYKTPDQILPGDSVVISWTYKEKGKTKTATSTLRIIQSQDKGWLVSLAMWEHDEWQFKAHERVEEITQKNFVIGVRQSVPPIMKKHQTFYFINFDDKNGIESHRL